LLETQKVLFGLFFRRLEKLKWTKQVLKQADCLKRMPLSIAFTILPIGREQKKVDLCLLDPVPPDWRGWLKAGAYLPGGTAGREDNPGPNKKHPANTTTPASPPSPPSILWIGPSKGTHFDGAGSKSTTHYKDAIG